ncbi:hypothetical protein F511_20953 [Dorcoceras hygrometricum]|uniref:Acyl-CoA dehydrogenase-related protein n=1 Tax=Dorcoceras hygrometricum TaxID=472368 RepID=A0A2Z7CCU2_9LAMI|nr:hypothetical protein F511_20953 [Dorcoceras hygrometricum]
MSLFDLQDVRIAIGSIATLDLPMVVDLIGIYGLKGPYCTLTTTNWFLQALSVIPRGSWGDVARRFTMIRWAALNSRPSSPLQTPPPPPPCAAARCRRKFVSGQLDEENPFVQNSSVLLVQPDEGVSVLVVDRIGDYLPQSTEKSRVLVISVGARHKCQQAPWPDVGTHWLRIVGRGMLQRLAFMRCASHVDARWRAIAPRLVAAVRKIHGGGGRQPVAAPVSPRRCRDGWSDFF